VTPCSAASELRIIPVLDLDGGIRGETRCAESKASLLPAVSRLHPWRQPRRRAGNRLEDRSGGRHWRYLRPPRGSGDKCRPVPQSHNLALRTSSINRRRRRDFQSRPGIFEKKRPESAWPSLSWRQSGGFCQMRAGRSASSAGLVYARPEPVFFGYVPPASSPIKRVQDLDARSGRLIDHGSYRRMRPRWRWQETL